MKTLSLLFAAALLSAGLTACGSSGNAGSTHASSTATASSTTARSSSSTTPAPVLSKADRDKDSDTNAYADDTNNNSILDFGHPANVTDKRAVTALVKRFYTTALAGDGAKACSMLYITLAESLPEDYGHESAGPSYLSEGRTCPAVMTLMFKHFRSLLTAELPRLKVARVRLIQHHGLAILSFGKMPEKYIPIMRERHTWKIGAPFDADLS